MSIVERRGTALITGASSKVGAVYANRLARRGYDLVLVARSRDRLIQLANSIALETGRMVEPLKADLNDHWDLVQIEERLRGDRHITMLVNNAGVGSVKPLLASDVDTMEDMIALNVVAFARLTYAAAPGMVERGNGTLINVASIAGIAPERMNGVYGATKAFVLALSQSLHHELASAGVRVQVVLAGATEKPFWQKFGLDPGGPSFSIAMTAEHIVDASLAGLDQGEIVTIPALQELEEWDRYEAARVAMSSRLSNPIPAARYGVAA